MYRKKEQQLARNWDETTRVPTLENGKKSFSIDHQKNP